MAALHARPVPRRLFLLAGISLLATGRAQAEAGRGLGAGALAGWAADDLETRHASASHPDLQLPMCSSFKWLLAAAVLSRVDRGLERLDRPLPCGRADLVFNSPTVAAAVNAGHASLSVGVLCEATVTLSDSAAANLLLPTVGGPPGLTAWLRATGDAVTRLDRHELDLNRVPPGDRRDTTSAAAMVGNLQRLLFGTGLTVASQALLLGWLVAARPGATRMPAGLRDGWRIGHKTGTWRVDPGHASTERNAAADVAVLLPPSGAPLLIAAYTAGSERPQEDVDRWFAGLVGDAIDARVRRSR